MKIGEIIKKLRKEANVTQEKLADYLGITYQAVSKWENGSALPDITLVVPLANFFNVNVNRFFAHNEEENIDKITAYQDQGHTYANMGNTQARVTLMRKALAEFPRNYDIMLSLAYAISSNSAKTRTDEDDHNEIIILCERILEDCTNSRIRDDAIQLLCSSYPATGQREKAIKLAQNATSMVVSSQMLLTRAYERGSDDYIQNIQRTILDMLDFLCDDLLCLARHGDLMTHERILHAEAAIKLFETIFYDGNLLFYHCRVSLLYRYLATWYMQKDIDKAMKCLLQSEKHAIAHDTIPDGDIHYTTVFLNKEIHNNARTSKSHINTEKDWLREYIKHEVFTPLYEHDDFIALKARLS